MFSADLGGYTAPLPDATNPPFQKVALLLHGDGTNGAQNNTFVDYSYPGGYAVSFDGSTQYLATPTSNNFIAGTGAFTFEAWVHPVSGGGNNTIFSCFTYTSGILIRRSTASNLEVYLVGSGVHNAGAIPLNTWTHIAVSRTAGQFRAFVNGVQVGTTTSNSSNITATSPNNYCWVGGAIHSGTAELFNGYISNARYVVGTALYTSDFTPSNQPLTAISGTQLLTCQSATIVDNSPNAFTITANGNAAAVSSKTITRTGNVAQGTFSPFSLAEGQWSNYFDGAGDYETVDYNTALNLTTGSWTVECWIYLNTVSTVQFLFDVTSPSSGFGQAAVATNGSGALYALASTDGSTWINASTGGVMTANSWNHIAFVRNGTSFNLYLNGVSVISYTSSANLFAPTGTEKTYIANSGGLNYALNGYMSNVRIVKGTAVYTSNFTPPTSALTAITNTSLLTCQSNRFVDNSSNNFTITPAGDTKVTAFSPFAPSAAYSASTNGGSAYFDGSGDYLSVANTTSLDLTGDFTIEAFVYATAMPSFNIICGNTSTLPYFGITSTSVEVGLNSGNYPGFSYTFVVNNWYHVVWVRQSGINKVFVNGVQLTITSGSASDSYTFTIDAIGKMADGRIFTGYISNFRIVNGTAVYTANFTPPTAPLTAISGTSLLLNCTNAGIIDNAGKNDIETVGNAQISTSVKKYGTGSMYFDGTGDYLRIPNSSLFNFGSENFTVEFWINPISLPSETLPFALVDGGFSYPFAAYLQSGQVKLLYNGSNTINTSATLTTNTWAHLAYVKNNGTITIYVNGISVGSASVSSINPTTNPIGIGGRGDDGRFPFNGYIDDLRITKGQALYTSNFTPPTQAFPNV